MNNWQPTVGQCLCCGGRGGWWIGVKDRATCPRCAGSGWDPAQNEPWFLIVVAQLQCIEGEGE
jgi:DnaJ-class molecular chaperone